MSGQIVLKSLTTNAGDCCRIVELVSKKPGSNSTIQALEKGVKYVQS